MTKHEIAMAAVRTVWHRLPLITLIVVGAFIAFCGVTLLVRQVQKQRGVGVVVSPAMPTAAYGDEPMRKGRFTTNIDYTSLDAPGNGEVTSSVAWDDGWFSADPTAYNHELATTAAVIATLAYSESGYYQAGNTQPAYMEHALSQLGFSDVSTESYQYRSEIVDEVLNLFTDESDTVAYAIARKRLQTAGGVSRDLILVSIRGSYGSEWLSNLNLMPGEQAATTAMAGKSSESNDAIQSIANALEGWMSFVNSLANRTPGVPDTHEAAEPRISGVDDHSGYFRAAEEICAELSRWIGESHDAGAEVSVLLTGHSRGGAIANLIAAELDEAMAVDQQVMQQQVPTSFSQVSAVYAHTFAAPATTVSSQAHAERYSNIFNIVNPSDIMPYLPLRSWGYERYGVNLYLPAVDGVDFDAKYEDMRHSYVQTVGVESGCDPADKRVIDRVINDVSNQIETARDLMTPTGVTTVVTSCAAHIDPVRILHGHYPSTYIAWMDVLDAGDLTRE